MASVPGEGWSMGLKGVWANVANATAVGLVCMMFWVSFRSHLEQAREDRTIFREAIEKLSDNSDKQWRAIRSLSGDVRRLSEEVKKTHPAPENIEP